MVDNKKVLEFNDIKQLLVVILGDSKEVLTSNIQILLNSAKYIGLEVNIGKTNTQLKVERA